MRYRDLASAGQTQCVHYCMGCCGTHTSHHDVNAVFVYLCLCEQWGWSQQERPMYYSDMSDSVVVRRCRDTLRVRGPAMLFLPVLSALTSCACRPPRSLSAGVSDLSPLYVEEEGNLFICSSQGLVSWCHSKRMKISLPNAACAIFYNFFILRIVDDCVFLMMASSPMISTTITITTVSLNAKQL